MGHRLWVWFISCCPALLLVFGFSIYTKHCPHGPAQLIVFFLSHSLPSFVCSFGESSWLSAAPSEPVAAAQGHCVAHPSPGHPCQACD